MTAVTALRINSVYLSASIPLRASREFAQPISCPWPAWPACPPHDFPPSQVPRLSCSSWFRDDVQFESNREAIPVRNAWSDNSTTPHSPHAQLSCSETDDVHTAAAHCPLPRRFSSVRWRLSVCSLDFGSGSFLPSWQHWGTSLYYVLRFFFLF